MKKMNCFIILIYEYNCVSEGILIEYLQSRFQVRPECLHDNSEKADPLEEKLDNNGMLMLKTHNCPNVRKEEIVNTKCL